MEWCTIESDPAVFTELLENIGVKGVSVEEVYDLSDKPYLERLGHIYGFIFLFRYTKNTEQRVALSEFDPDLFYARQVVTNACGTQALLSVIMNIPDLEIGSELKEFKEFTMALDPESRGYALGESKLLRTHHNSFAKPEPFVMSQTTKAKDGDDVFHFIAYIPFKKQVYELDGIEKGPILLGEVSSQESWIEVAQKEINKRIEQYAYPHTDTPPRKYASLSSLSPRAEATMQKLKSGNSKLRRVSCSRPFPKPKAHLSTS